MADDPEATEKPTLAVGIDVVSGSVDPNRSRGAPFTFTSFGTGPASEVEKQGDKPSES